MSLRETFAPSYSAKGILYSSNRSASGHLYSGSSLNQFGSQKQLHVDAVAGPERPYSNSVR
jgi:hypothetical protein